MQTYNQLLSHAISPCNPGAPLPDGVRDWRNLIRSLSISIAPLNLATTSLPELPPHTHPVPHNPPLPHSDSPEPPTSR